MAEKVVSKLRGNMWRLIILAVAGSLIYGLPYFRTYYYDAYLQAYNLTNTQMGSLGSIFGVFGMISYLFGGVVADFISPKKLISISLIPDRGGWILPPVRHQLFHAPGDLPGVGFYSALCVLARIGQGYS